MRKIGFDFDGVLAEKISFDGDIKKYQKSLLNAKPLLNPFKIKRSDDKIYIITGRYTDHYYHTIEWLNKHYPNYNFNYLKIYNIYFVNHLDIDDKYYEHRSKYILYISRMKLQKIIDLGLDIYFEDNKFTIDYLRFYMGKKCIIIDVKDLESIDFETFMTRFLYGE